MASKGGEKRSEAEVNTHEHDEKSGRLFSYPIEDNMTVEGLPPSSLLQRYNNQIRLKREHGRTNWPGMGGGLATIHIAMETVVDEQ